MFMGFVADVFKAGVNLITGGAIDAQTDAANQAAAAQRESNAIQQRMADVQAARSRRDAIRQARIAQGTIAQGAASSGVITSSGTAGSQASVASQTGSNLSFLDTTQAASKQMSIFNQKAADAQTEMFKAQLQGQTVMTGLNLATGLYKMKGL